MASVLETCVQITFVIFFALHSSSSQQATTSTSNDTVGSVLCYQCNSADSFDGSACATTIGIKNTPAFLKLCPYKDMHDNLYNHCRKIVQTVQVDGVSDTRVIRSCATTGTSKSGYCMDKVGTARVSMKYCDCYNSDQATINRQPCNSSPNQNTAVMSLVMTSAFISVILAVIKAM